MPSFPKYNRQLNQHCVVERFFSDEEVDKIIDLEELQQFTEGKVGSGTAKLDKKARDSEISWLFPSNESRWVFDKFTFLVAKVNYDHFLLDIDGFESFQYTKYKNKQHYNWHYDVELNYATWERKISATVVLTDPEKYDGGEFEIVTNGNIEQPLSIKPPKGSVIFFASWMPHRVAPVKSGVRKSLVAWIMGKRVC
jgi:PKHD-type hydroxylase